MKPLSYKQQPVNEQFDAIIIGSGMGGLATAALLAKQGKKTLVLEKHYTPGGFTHSFKRKNYEWDVGIHYIGGLDRPSRMIYRMFDYITEGRQQWADMGEVYDRIIFGEKEYQFVKGTENWRAKMKEYLPSPQDHNSIDDYIELINKANASFRPYFMQKALPPLAGKVMGLFSGTGYKKYTQRSTLDVLRDITKNPQLMGVLTGQYGDYGLPPSQSSFAIHALVVKHYFDGGYYPVGGAGSIFDNIYPVIEKAGGKVYVNAEVKEIIVRNGKAVGVKMADGRELLSNIIISNAGFINTYSKLVPSPNGNGAEFARQLKEVEPSAAHLSLYLGLKHTAKELNLPKANYWIYPDNYDHDANLRDYLADPSAPLPVAYISFPAAKDPDFENRFPGRSTIEIIGFAPYDWFQQWEGTQWHHRGEEYEAMKAQYSQRLLQQLYRFEPQVKGKVDHCELSTPLSTANFVNYSRGEIYGLTHTPQRFALKYLQPRTPIKNLFLTGQDISTCGIAGALMSGALTASAILKKNVMSEALGK